MLKRALGVKGAVLALYGLGAIFAGLGIAMSLGRARVVYAIALVFGAFIVVIAIKIARRKQIEEQAARYEAMRSRKRSGQNGGASTPEPETALPK